ncbi:hypothetical protein P154DRAFT_525987 [Amniculicola lignicola CBS 123094]|uniref:BRCT domain-containing protein n=1 Tax=Amniculicola lignicola CBS 123094 TaxID=1392246 RepID=A0A6A5W3T6_9PLEO|nr:hypothetical protein P154DRAFT_525987 [Amniculicola lignicola CBS 123094]
MEDTTMMDASQGLFEGCRLTIVPNELSEDEQRQLEKDINNNGGTLVPFDTSKGHIEQLERITHIISTTSDFPDYYRALDLMLPVVKPTWVAQSLKAKKLKSPRSCSPDPAFIMSDVVICCGDIPEGDKDAIEGGALAMGGQTSAGLSKFVTHLIALSTDDPRCQMASSKRLHCLLVLPHWFDDCLKLGKRISEQPYLLHNPTILDVQAEKIPAVRASLHIKDASNPEPSSEPPAPLPIHLQPHRAIKAFQRKKVMLGGDLDLPERLKGIITGLIQAGEGTLVTIVDDADIYVCNYRDGADYIKASQAKKDVGNLSWLYYLITHNTWTNPMRRLLHYPRPREGVPGFKGLKISISSYTGEARVYLESLIKATGAEFTKTFKQDNTHLITAHKQSEKYEAAQEWGVNIVNHMWLEESYAQCKQQSLTNPVYNYFPSRTNLGEVLGQTEINPNAMEKLFFAKTKASKATKAAPVPASSVPTRVASDPVGRSSPLKEQARRTNTVAAVATPVANRRTNGKENDTPGTTGSSRGAKDRALSRLHDAAPDIAQFEKEMKRRGGVIHGGRKEKDDDASEKSKKSKGRESTASKRSIDEVDGDGDDTMDEVDDEPARKTKKARKEKAPPVKYRMLVSKMDRWVDNHDQQARDKSKLRELGILVTEDIRHVDILCAPKIVRTKKFVSALACAPIIVSTSFIETALKTNKIPPPEKHPLLDHEYENLHGFHMDEAIVRAKQNHKHLLKDWTIFCTEHVGFENFKEIVAANGGQAQMWKGRTTTVTATKRSVNTSAGTESQNQVEDEGDVLYLISEGKKQEFPLWVKFRELAVKHDMVPRIVTTDWLLWVTMAQKVHWDPRWELSEELVKLKS